MVIHSPFPKKDYLRRLKASMDSHWSFLAERCTGYFLGPVIYVTYHSGWEWNRRISNQRNTALGFVRSSGEGTQIRYILFKGMLAPHYLLALFLFYAVLFPLLAFADGGNTIAQEWLLPLTLISTLISAGLVTWMECLTDESYDGAIRLQRILTKPIDPYSTN